MSGPRKFIGAQGEKHHNAKLTEDKVREMRRLHEQKKLCKRCVAILHDVNYGTAWDVLTYNTWRNVR